MNEYSKFLKQFNGTKDDAASDLSANEDIIPASGAFSKKEADKPAVTNDTVKEEVSAAGKLPDINEDSTDSIPAARFIKTNETPFISVNGDNDSEFSTHVEKYSDRLLPNIPVRKTHTGYTGKIRTYADNHSPAAADNNFIITDKEDASDKDIKEVSLPEGGTKIIPRISELSADKRAEGGASEKTKHISAKGELLREIAKTSGSVPPEDEDQLTMEGFSLQDEEPQGISPEEEELVRELSEVRQKRIKNFRFWSKGAVETGESEDKSFEAAAEEKKLPEFLKKTAEKYSHLDTDLTPVDGDEYTDPTKRKEIFAKLIAVRKNVIFRTLGIALLGVILLIINLAATVSAAMNNGFFTIFNGSALAYNIVNLVFLLIAGVLMLDDLKKGLFSVLKIRPKTDSALLFMYIGALVQNISAFFSVLKPESDYHMLTGAVILLCVPLLLSKVFYYDSTRHCFKAVAATSDKCYLRKVSDTGLVAELLKDSSNSETNVVYAGKTRFISGFLKRSAASSFAGQASSRVIALSMGCSIIAGLIGLITKGSMVYAFGCLTHTAALSFPISCLLFTGYVLSNENSNLSVKSSFVGSYSDAYKFCCIDDIILDSSDIFSAEVISLASGQGVSEKQAMFCAAALVNKTEGMLKKAFSGLMPGFEDRFPDAEHLIYEDRLGFSAWISDCKVLLGTKEFLVNHNVELPRENTVPFVLEENSRPMFLAIEGHFAAVFSVKYSCNREAADSLCELAKHGANILISVKDPNITEEFGEELLGLPSDSLRIIKNTTNEKFAAQKNTVTDSEETGIIFGDSFQSFAKTMASSVKLDKLKRVAKTFCEAGAVAGSVFGLILTITGSKTGISGWIAVLLQIFWILLCFFAAPTVAATALREKIKLPDNIASRLRSQPSGDPYKEIYDSEEETESDDESNTEEEAEPEEEITEEISDEASVDFDDDSTQLSMGELIYEELPDPIDFSLITGHENDVKEEETAEEAGEQTISDDILDDYARYAPVKNEIAEDVTDDEDEFPEKMSLLERLGYSGKRQRRSDEDDIENRKIRRRSILSFMHDDMPEPPKYDLSKKEEKEEDDPLNVTFVPPENDAPSAVYRDEFFASYDAEEDDKAFADLKRKREEDEEGDFDFWTLR